MWRWRNLYWLAFGVVCVSLAYLQFGGANSLEFVNVKEPVEVRGGISHLRAKLEAGESVTVAFLGGSITQNSAERGFAKLVPQWIESKFPGVRVTAVNAGMGGTDSEWGAKRLDRDVLEAKPDVVFVEFAVNDGDRDSIADMERIVRKVRAFSGTADVVFIYAMTESTAKMLVRERMPRAIANHERVADRHGVASILLGVDLRSRMASGEWTWSNFSADNCHPTPEGYASYNRDMASALQLLFGAKAVESDGERRLLRPEVELYPPKIVAEKPQVGEGALAAEEMPEIGREWVGSPFWPDESDPVWCLRYSVRDGTTENFEDLPLCRWFEEARAFTGAVSRIVATGNGGQGSVLAGGPWGKGRAMEVPVVQWTAREKGHYQVRVDVGGLSGHENGEHPRAGFEMFLVRAREVSPTMLGTAQMMPAGGEPLTMSVNVSTEAGDRIYFRAVSSGFEYFALEGVTVRMRRSASEANEAAGG